MARDPLEESKKTPQESKKTPQESKKTPQESEKPPQDSKKTPYQGKKRCFGHFKCPKYNREWASASSWANIWQKCFECQTKAYPHAQQKLEKRQKSKRTGEKKHHLEDLCEKCRIIGSCCLSIVQGK